MLLASKLSISTCNYIEAHFLGEKDSSMLGKFIALSSASIYLHIERINSQMYYSMTCYEIEFQKE